MGREEGFRKLMNTLTFIFQLDLISLDLCFCDSSDPDHVTIIKKQTKPMFL